MEICKILLILINTNKCTISFNLYTLDKKSSNLRISTFDFKNVTRLFKCMHGDLGKESEKIKAR